jgi:uncharacterized membrane protein YfcA
MTEPAYLPLTSLGTGAVVGLVLGLLGAGGSILATPLLLYEVGVSQPMLRPQAPWWDQVSASPSTDSGWS